MAAVVGETRQSFCIVKIDACKIDEIEKLSSSPAKTMPEPPEWLHCDGIGNPTNVGRIALAEGNLTKMRWSPLFCLPQVQEHASPPRVTG
jgi:hypothetical protein